MSNRDKPPVRQGEIYCSPWCGCRCTYADFERATNEGNALVERLGPAWTARVWENMGWHVEAVAGCWKVRVQFPGAAAEADEAPTYQAWFNGPGVGCGTVQFIDDEYSADPLETLRRVKSDLDAWHLALLPKLYLPLPGQGPTRATDGTAWEITMPSEMDRLQGDDNLRVKLLGRTAADIDAAYRSLLENCGWNVGADHG